MITNIFSESAKKILIFGFEISIISFAFTFAAIMTKTDEEIIEFFGNFGLKALFIGVAAGIIHDLWKMLK